jgi:hypothetical protein
MIKEGVPMAGGSLYVFSDASGPPPSFDFRYWRVPDEVVRIGTNGEFNVSLETGIYYLGAIQRQSGEEIGPLREGDLYLPLPGENIVRQYRVKADSAIDAGTITGALTFSRANVKTAKGISAIEGKIVDGDGKPVANALVFAFLSPSMTGRPLFISERTGSDGRYQLRVDEGGSYYLKIRSAYGGGSMQTGEISGSYGKVEPEAVEVKTGAIVRGIDIVGSRFKREGQKKQP